ncbi:MAG: AmmeMemoRadiSam system protein A [Coriobacteriia bacterium]|nr:AmmeMemoRadiSam system protein A [Coriobacteriia bacterium]
MNKRPSLPVRIATSGLRWYLEHGTLPSTQRPAIAVIIDDVKANGSPEEQELLAMLSSRAAGVFVSYHVRANDDLRGCIGTISATTSNVLEEICRNTVCAGTEDPRFRPITINELPNLTCSVDVLGAAEPISGFDELDVKRYGVIVSNGRRRGLLLPDLEGVDTPQEQVSIALAKAGIHPHAPYDMERFEVIRYE